MKTNIIFMGNGGNFELTALKTVIDRKLIIPSYQRPYAWDEDNIEDLFNTIKDSIEEEKTSKLHDEKNRHPAFFGSVIFSTQNHNEYLIIDGQQRVTTFLFILRVIQEKLSQDWNQIMKNLEVLDRALDEAQEQGDIKKSKEIFANRMKIENRNKDYYHLIDKIEEILKKTNISRGATDSKNENDKTESEYISYITEKKFKKSKDFEKNKNKISDRINNIIDDIVFRSSEYQKYNRIVDYILNVVKFCLLNIEGENSEEYAIDVFNTLNSTGELLTGFEVFKSKIMQFGKTSEERRQIEKDLLHIENSIKKQKPNRKDLITQSGKLLLYLAVHRDDYKKNKLSDKNFKDQNTYIKNTLKQDNALEILEDIKGLSDFVVQNWLPKKNVDRAYSKHLSSKDFIFTLKGFDFLKDINHDRVIPVIYKWSEQFLGKKFSLNSYQTIVKLCTAFSCLWRMASHGGASGIDQEYLMIAKKLKNEKDITIVQSVIWNRFKESFPDKKSWLDQVAYSNINKNKTITKFLLSLISLKDISSYYSTDWVSFPIFNDRNTIDKIGNIILIPKTKEKDFKNDIKNSLSKLLKDNSLNADVYEDITDDFTNTQIDQRTIKLSQLIWKKLAEDVFDCK